MKQRICILTALLCVTASLGFAMQIPDFREATTLDIMNEDRIPHSVSIDANNRTIQVFAREGGSAMLPPGQSVAMRAGHGPWRIYGDSGRDMQVRLQRGHNYKLHLRPYSHGDVRTLVGIIDDGYSHYDAPLVDMREHRHMDDYPPNYYDPRYHHTRGDGPGYPYGRPESHESLGSAIHDAFDHFLENVGNNAGYDTNHPYYVPPHNNPW